MPSPPKGRPQRHHLACGSLNDRMRRRDLLALLGGIGVSWPFGARPQQKALPVIGFLGGATLGTNASNVAAFHLGLGETGYAEEQNVVIDYRWAEQHYDRLPALAADLYPTRRFAPTAPNIGFRPIPAVRVPTDEGFKSTLSGSLT